MRHGLQSGCANFSHPFLPSVTVRIPDGDAGVTQTIRYMKALVRGPKGVGSWVVQAKAKEAVRGVERGQNEIDSVFQWVLDHIEFRGEYGETLQSPEATINLGAGDCDCQAILTAALLEVNGFETDFKTVAMRDSAGEFSHVYGVVKGGQWLPVDTTVQAAYPGWEPPEAVRARTYGVMRPPQNGGLIGALLGMFRR